MQQVRRARGALVTLVALGSLLAGTACAPPGSPGIGGGFVVKDASMTGNWGSYKVVLVGNPFIELFRPLIQEVVAEANAYSGAQSYVAAGVQQWRAFQSGTIEIELMACDPPPDPNQVTLACASTSAQGAIYSYGHIALTTDMNVNMPGEAKAVIEHEIGHTLGLGHYDLLYNGQPQIMVAELDNSGASVPSGYKDGDRAGLAWMFSHGPRNGAP